MSRANITAFKTFIESHLAKMRYRNYIAGFGRPIKNAQNLWAQSWVKFYGRLHNTICKNDLCDHLCFFSKGRKLVSAPLHAGVIGELQHIQTHSVGK